MELPQCPVIIRARLENSKADGLGIIVGQRSEVAPTLMVGKLMKNGEADLSGLVRPGDIILQLNDRDVSKCSYEEAVSVFRSLEADTMVRLVLRAPFGYTTRLETSFTVDGQPRTFRITERIYTNTTTNNSSNNDSPCKTIANSNSITSSVINLQENHSTQQLAPETTAITTNNCSEQTPNNFLSATMATTITLASNGTPSPPPTVVNLNLCPQAPHTLETNSSGNDSVVGGLTTNSLSSPDAPQKW